MLNWENTEFSALKAVCKHQALVPTKHRDISSSDSNATNWHDHIRSLETVEETVITLTLVRRL